MVETVRIVIEKIPEDWKIIEHMYLNSSEGHGAEPYCVDVYEDSKGGKHEVFVGTFNADDARRN
jgi:hypothetical protein